METINLLLESIGLAILHSLWHGLILGLLILVIFRFEHRAAERFNLAISGMAIMLLFFIGNIFLYYSVAATSGAVSAERMIVFTENILMAAPEMSVSRSENWFVFTVASVWLLGIVLSSKWHFYKWISHQLWIRKQVRPLTAYHRHFIKSLAGFEHIEFVKLADGISSPAVTGFFKPIILLPLSYVTQWPPEQLQSLLLHEWEHIRRKDHLTLAFQQFCSVIFFYHPLVWWLNTVMYKERELAVDRAIIHQGVDKWNYAKALYHAGLHSNSNYRLELAADKGKPGLLQYRIEQIFFQHKSVNKMKTSWIVIALGMLIMLGGINLALKADFNSDKIDNTNIHLVSKDSVPVPPTPPSPPRLDQDIPQPPPPPKPPAPPVSPVPSNTSIRVNIQKANEVRIDTVFVAKKSDTGEITYDTVVVIYEKEIDKGYIPQPKIPSFDTDFKGFEFQNFDFENLFASVNFSLPDFDHFTYGNYFSDSVPAIRHRHQEISEEYRMEMQRLREQLASEREILRLEREKMRERLREEMPEIRRQMEQEIMEVRTQARELAQLHRQEMREFNKEQQLEMQRIMEALHEEMKKLRQELNADH